MRDGGLLVAVLAAGASRRLGRPKQLVKLDGETLVRRQCRVALEADVGPVVAILGCELDACAPALSGLSVSIIANKQWREGLGSSIRTATRAAMATDAAGLLILHGDQYRVTAPDLRDLHATWIAAGGLKACRSRHNEHRGPPVILPAACFPAALHLAGEDGARGILSAIGSDGVVDVTMPNAAYDLDLPAHLASLSGSGSTRRHEGTTFR